MKRKRESSARIAAPNNPEKLEGQMDTHGPTNGSRKRIGVFFLTIFASIVLFNGILGLLITIWLNDSPDQQSSATVAEAKWNGTFVTSLNASPSAFCWHGEEITIEEAWIEHQSQRLYTIVLVPGLLHIPVNKHIAGYHIGMNLKRGREVFRASDTPFFVVDYPCKSA